MRSPHTPPRSLLPLVSVVIVKFNYARYLKDAIDSVFTQTYPRVQCIVVDNASTDHSLELIARYKADRPDLCVLQLSSNEGQSGACMRGLAASSAPYVIFLDADDYLLPNCVEIHLHVHLSSRVHVGFTFGSLLQIKNGEVVVSNNEATVAYMRDTPSSTPDLLRPSREALGEIWSSFDPGLMSSCHLIPRTMTRWVWAPTSGNCFRRDALDLLCNNDDLAGLRSQTDLYLAMGLNALTGSIFIDRPVFAYRLHGQNVFSSRPHLNGLISYDPKISDKNSCLARKLLINHLTSHIDNFIQYGWQVDDFFLLLRRLDITDTSSRHVWAQRSYLAQSAVNHMSKLSGCAGRRKTLRFLMKIGVPLRKLKDLI